MGTSNLRDRLSRVTEGAPAHSRRGHGSASSGGWSRMLRGEAPAQSGSGLGMPSWLAQSSRWPGGFSQSGPRDSAIPAAARGAAGRAGSAFTGAADLATRAGHSAASATREAPAAARGAAGWAGSAFTGAAEKAARASQSAASATRDASTAFAHRVSDASNRMAEREDISRMGPRDRWAGGRQDDRSHTRGGAAWGERGWDEPASRSWNERGVPGRWGQGGMMEQETMRPGWEQPESGRRGRRARGATIAPEAFELRPARGEQRRGRRDVEVAGRDRSRAGGQPWDGQSWQWARPDGAHFDELRSHGARGVSKRNVKRIEKAQESADLSARRAFEASERALQHGHSRRARKQERKAVAQADSAQRMLEQHLLRAERHLVSNKRRRRRGLGLVLLAGAGAGGALAVRRMMSQRNRPDLRPEQQPAARTGMTTGAAYPSGVTDPTRATGVTTSPTENLPGHDRDRLSDTSSSTHRF